MKLEDIVLQFLNLYCPQREPLLLGLSGGPDSMALFHLLLGACYPFEVAHVDHGWRKTSQQEGANLAEMCREKNVLFHLKTLPSIREEKNLEDRGRKARHTFFKAVISERKLYGVVLAHQADDHAETVLKRLFEGASLPKLKGLVPKTKISEITLYRPLLQVKKNEILAWLKKRDIAYFIDPTNEDPRFLRSRLRCELIPSLSDRFGKEVTSNLCRLGESAAELEGFLEGLIAPYREQIRKNSGEVSLDFSACMPSSHFLWKAILRDFFEKQKLPIPHTLLVSILQHLDKGSCHKSLKVSKYIIKIHKRKLTFISRNNP